MYRARNKDDKIDWTGFKEYIVLLCRGRNKDNKIDWTGVKEYTALFFRVPPKSTSAMGAAQRGLSPSREPRNGFTKCSYLQMGSEWFLTGWISRNGFTTCPYQMVFEWFLNGWFVKEWFPYMSIPDGF